MLNVARMDAFYGKKQVLFGIDMTLAGRCIAAVIGPNGAGKSTVLRAVFGLGPQREGTIRFDDRDVSRATPPQNIAAGIAFVPQGARVFRDLTVFENLRMGGYTLGSTISTAVPNSSRMPTMASKICATSIGASPIEGSSIISRRGRSINAMPKASICRSPPESAPAFCVRRSRRTGNALSAPSIRPARIFASSV